MRVRLGRTGHTGRSAPPAPYRTPTAYDLIDAPAGPGHRVLLRLERLGAPLGPVLAVPGGRLHFFVEAGSTAAFAAHLAELGWTPAALDIRAVGDVAAADAALPPPDSPRWVRPPDLEWSAAYPPAHLLLGSLVYACRYPGAGAGSAWGSRSGWGPGSGRGSGSARVPTQAGHRKAA